MKANNLITIETLIRAFEAADRQGSDNDEPEGARYITISDTLLRQITERLRYIVESEKSDAP